MSFGSDDPQVSAVGGGVYEEARPYISDIMKEAARLYGSDIGRNYYPGSTVVPFAPETEAALNLQKSLGFDMTGDSAYYDMAGSTLGGFASGAMPSSYSQLTPQADYLSDVRSGILSDVMGDISTQFGGMGRTGTSPGAQQAAARGFTSGYAPIAAEQASLERGRELESLESGLGRQFRAAGALPGLQDTMDARRLRGISGISGVGSAYEDLAGRTLQDRINRYEFEQRSPYDRLNSFMSPLISIGSFQNPSYEYSGGGSRFGSALGGAGAGYQLGSQFGGMGGMFGTLLGGLGGLLG